MERVMYLWDELDDLVRATRYLLRKAWHGLCDRDSITPAIPASPPADLAPLAD